MREHSPTSLELKEATTADLVREALDEAKELVKLEVQIARDDVKSEIEATKRAAIGFGLALAMGIVVLSALATAIILALGATVLAALAVATVFLLVGAIAGYVAYAKVPKSPLAHTRRRVERDVKALKEHLA